MTLDSLSSIERQQNILAYLSKQKRISVSEICEMFAVSEATARRDLEVLTDQNSPAKCAWRSDFFAASTACIAYFQA